MILKNTVKHGYYEVLGIYDVVLSVYSDRYVDFVINTFYLRCSSDLKKTKKT